MNITVTTSDNSGFHTIIPPLTGEVKQPFQGVSLLLLCRRGKPFLRGQLNKLHQFKVPEILCILESGEVGGERFSSIPGCKTILIPPGSSPGEQINIGVREAMGSHVFILWDDMDLQQPALTERQVDHLRQMDCLCQAPMLMNHFKDSVPVRLIPWTEKGLVKLRVMNLRSEGQPSLYPFDYCGIYNREKFLLCEGYDPRIRAPYWQKMDFGFRIGLWGEQSLCTTGLRLAYQREIPGETIPIDASYRRFFLKNLALKFSKGEWRLSKGAFLGFHLDSGMSFLGAFEEYKVLSRWVKDNSYRFGKSAWDFLDEWDGPA